MRREKLPYIPLEVGGHTHKGTRAHVWFTCPKLGTNGRCTIYDDRPQICRIFTAATDALCVFHSIVKDVDDAGEIDRLLAGKKN